MICKSCGTEFEGNFCKRCGMPANDELYLQYEDEHPTRTSYMIEDVVVKAGIFTDAQDRIRKKIQPMLDLGARKGWKLHTFTSTDSARGINICLVWEIQEMI